MIPECCQKCPSHKGDSTCGADNKNCSRWQLWFAQEWAGIRLAAQKIKENRQKGGRKK